jgi:phosphoribosyl 1,2-cyclic phosphodiesterase
MDEGAQVESGVRVCALASGSSGNAFVVEAGDIRLLFDAGLNAAALEHYMWQRGVAPEQLGGIFVSHEHIDHVRGVGMLARRYRLPVIATQGTFKAGAYQLGSLPETLVQPPGGEVLVGGVGGVTVRTFSVSHDAAEATGFWIEAQGQHIVICTDLGCETPSIQDALKAADLLILESNHDIRKLWRGPYHPALKKRVAGPYGHLSNAEAGRMISELARDGRQRTVWLAHLSEVNNTPAMALDTVNEPLQREECTHLRVEVLARGRPSHVWRAERPVLSRSQA